MQGDFADGVISFEGQWLGAETFGFRENDDY
jgi:hypothetical protein